MPIDLTDLHRRWIFTLEIAGLVDPTGAPIRYTSHRDATPATVPGHPFEPTYTDIPCITDVSAIRSRIDLIGGVAEHGPCTVTLAARPLLTGDPEAVFSLIGRRSATFHALATRSLPVDATLPYDLTVDRDLSARAPGLVNIGAEQLYISAAGGTDPDPDSVDPYTVTITARGVANTRVRAHVAEPASVDLPLITGPEVVFWRTRPARILVEDARRPGDPIEIFRGLIDQTPDPDGSGAVRVELVPLTTLLDKAAEIRAPASKTTLVEGYHCFSDRAANVFEVYQRQNEVRGGVRANTASGSGLIDVDEQDAAQWAASFDASLPITHPRAGSVVISGRGRAYDVEDVVPDPATPLGPEETFDLVNGPDADVTTTMRWSTRPATEAKRAFIIEPGDDPEVLVWPGSSVDGLDGAFGRINDQLDVELHTGLAGAAFGVRLDASLPDRLMRVRRNVASNGQQEPFFPIVVFGFDRDSARAGLYDYREIDQLWPESGEIGPAPTGWTEVGVAAQDFEVADTRAGLHYPFEWARLERSPGRAVPGAEPETWFFKGGSATRAEDWIPAVEVSRAFYSRGERYLLVEDEIDISDGRIAVRVDKRLNVADDGDTYDRQAFAVEVDEIVPVVLAAGPRAGETVYRLRLTRPDDVRSFGVWRAEGLAGTVEIFGGAQAETVLGFRDNAGATIGEALEWLLTSPATLALTADDVDIPSLHRFAAPWLPSFDLSALAADPGLTYGDVISSIAMMTGTALVMRTAANRTRLTRIHVGIEIATEVAARIDEGDWSRAKHPKWGRDDDIVNQVVVQTGFDRNPDKPGDFADDPTEINDRASTAAHDERKPTRIDDYSGLTYADAEVDLAAMAQRIFRLFGAPRRTFKGQVGTYKGIPLGVGAVAQVSSPHLRAYKLPKGVYNVTSRVLEQTLDLWREGCELVMVHFGASGGGWAPSARVAQVVDPTTVIVDANAYSDPLHPTTGLLQEDLDDYAVGQAVSCEPYYDIDAAIERQIVELDRGARRVKFDGAHALAVGDSIIPAWRPNAPQAHRLYAYLGDGENNVQELV